MNDIFSQFLGLTEPSAAVSMQTILLCLLSAFVLAQIAAWVYVWSHRGVTYSATMAQSLVVLALIVALVMLVIGNSLARAFGLFGALALIRFRTPVKDAWDTVFLFLGVAIGIAAGTQNLLVAAIGTLIICLVIAFLSISRFGARLHHDGMLRLRLPPGGEEEADVRRVLGDYFDGFQLVHLRETGPSPAVEFAYQVKIIDPRFTSELLAELRKIQGATGLSLLMQDQEAMP
jgi:hypothetical protein